jgi:hypothetical protein
VEILFIFSLKIKRLQRKTGQCLQKSQMFLLQKNNRFIADWSYLNKYNLAQASASDKAS